MGSTNGGYGTLPPVSTKSKTAVPIDGCAYIGARLAGTANERQQLRRVREDATACPSRAGDGGPWRLRA
jgi:hypothetical protein